jgi:hypothetical protein
MWHKPSTPSAISTNAPNCAVRSTLPWTTSPTRCCGEEALPHVGLQLLDAQAQAAVLRLNAENDSLHLFALLHDLRGVLDALGPAQVRDVNQAVDAVLDLDEGAKVGQVANPALDHVPAG